ncbi:hypothetical protein L1987_24766 [Smallanthus sonchifolius]|uniref:Uncharacterized protein n=1 Tax=Smallanthus sonchifolius TaxID=185202 RepID=A0ACB9IN36_9ASTR|nr:hypothetical protein L1987_24766 [Smallanthus sonchifolius]
MSASSDGRLLVNMTVVRRAGVIGAYCLDGSLPAYHIHRGFGAGARNWILQFEDKHKGGGWCNDIKSCAERAQTRRGSTRLMNKLETFSGILSNNASRNPDNVFSLSLSDLALLSGCSAGGLASYLHCNNFSSYLPNTTAVKCLGDAGFFLDSPDINMYHTQRTFFQHLVTLQCIFPQYLLKYITPPLFILNSAYDVYQFHHILVPPSADLRGRWNHCKLNPKACRPDQIHLLHGS